MIGLSSTDAADVFDVGVQFISQTEIQSELGPNTPVVLDKARQVSAIGVGNQQWLGGLAAAYRDREQQIVVVDPAIAVAIEIRKVFDHLNATLLKHPQIKISIDALNLAAEIQRVIAPNHRERVAELQASLFSPLRHAERCAVLNAGEGS